MIAGLEEDLLEIKELALALKEKSEKYHKLHKNDVSSFDYMQDAVDTVIVDYLDHELNELQSTSIYDDDFASLDENDEHRLGSFELLGVR